VAQLEQAIALVPSSLLNDLLRQIAKEKTGAYQAPYYFTEAAESY
jgi:deoxyribose-phosphate aldolase